MKRPVLVAAFALSQVIAAAAQDQPMAMNQGQMNRLDRDGNGAVDRPEYQAFMTSAFGNLTGTRTEVCARKKWRRF